MIKHKIQIIEKTDDVYYIKCEKCINKYIISQTDIEGAYLASVSGPNIHKFNTKFTRCSISDEEYRMRELLK